MTALKPVENRRVRAVASERYLLNKVCAHPECKEPVNDPHHAFPRSAIGGDSWFVEILETRVLTSPEDGSSIDYEDFQIIPHVTGLCRAHHDQVEIHESWIKLEDGVWNWYDRAEEEVPHQNDAYMYEGHEPEWTLVGPLNPQPGSVEGKPKRKKFQGKDRRERKVISVRVPNDAEEDGAGLLDDAIEALETKLQGDREHRPIYYTIMAALNYTNLNADETDFE